MPTINDTSTPDTPPVRVETSPGNRYVLTNRGGGTLCVPVVNAKTGEVQEVFVQPGGQPKLAFGFTVDPVFAARNPDMQAIKVS